MEKQPCISLKQYIVHILDRELNLPILSEVEHVSNKEVDEFITNHIMSVFKQPTIKLAQFIDSENSIKVLCTKLAEDNEKFNDISSSIAKQLFELIEEYKGISSCDLICALFENQKSTYLGIIKFNYRTSFIHHVDNNLNKKTNSIIKQTRVLPAINQKVEECALINLDNFNIFLVEKPCDINGEKKLYFSKLFLKCTSQISDYDKIKLFNKATDDFNKTYFQKDFIKPAEVRNAVKQCIESENKVNVAKVAKQIFKEDTKAIKDYVEHVESYGIKDNEISINKNIIKNNFYKQTLKTDRGIELNIPVDLYNNFDALEFINNPDGTISILIKNVGILTQN